jgi:hypothetical protein
VESEEAGRRASSHHASHERGARRTRVGAIIQQVGAVPTHSVDDGLGVQS